MPNDELHFRQWFIPMINLLSDSLTLLLAQTGGNATNSASWALVLFCVILGMLVTLNPPRRTSEVKKAKE